MSSTQKPAWMRRFGVLSGAMMLTLALTPSVAAAAAARHIKSDVLHPSVTLSSAAADGTDVTYGVTFATSASGAVPAGGTVTIAAPSGTTLPGQPSDYTINDEPRSTNCTPSGVTLANTAASATLGVQCPIGASDLVAITITGASNPATPSAGDAVAVSTSAEPSPVSTGSFSIVAAGSLAPLAVHLGSTTQGASAVSYLAEFATSSSGALTQTQAITLSASAGTTFSPAVGNYLINDLSNGRSCSPAGASVSGGGDTVAITTGCNIGAGDLVAVNASDVTNTTASSGSLAVTTNSDTQPATASYSLAAPAAVSRLLVRDSSNVANQAGATFQLAFTTSSHGALADDGTITLSAPAGTTLSTQPGDYKILDLNRGQSCAPSGVSSSAAQTVTLTVGCDLGAGDAVMVSAANATNSANPIGGTFSVSTSSDPVAKSGAVRYPAATTSSHVLVPSTHVSSSSANATSVTYSVRFRTSAAGGLGTGGTITLSAASGTSLSSVWFQYLITDTTTGASCNPSPSGVALSNGGASATITLSNCGGFAINPGDVVVVFAGGAGNPSATGSDHLAVSTSSDTTPASTSYAITAATGVSSAFSRISSASAAATGVTYAVGFTASAEGGIVGNYNERYGSITLTAPSGTAFSPNWFQYLVTDTTTGETCNPAPGGIVLSNNDATTTLTLSNCPSTSIGAGDQLVVLAKNTTNPAGPTTGTLQITTSSDTVATARPVRITAASSVSSPTVVLSSTAADASAVTYAASFTTSASGGLVGNYGDRIGSITLAAPAGTGFSPNWFQYLITDVTTGDSCNAAPGDVTLSNSGATTNVILSNCAGTAIDAGDRVLVYAEDSTNPTSPTTGSVAISTSSDTAASGVPVSITTAQGVGATSINLSSSTHGANATYTVGFTTSSSGGLVGNYFERNGSITLAAPSGTVLSGNWPDYVLTDSTGLVSCAAAPGGVVLSNGGATATVYFSNCPTTSVGPSDVLSLAAANVTNPSSTGSGNHISVSTSSDTVPVATPGYAIT